MELESTTQRNRVTAALDCALFPNLADLAQCLRRQRAVLDANYCDVLIYHPLVGEKNI